MRAGKKEHVGIVKIKQNCSRLFRRVALRKFFVVCRMHAAYNHFDIRMRFSREKLCIEFIRAAAPFVSNPLNGDVRSKRGKKPASLFSARCSRAATGCYNIVAARHVGCTHTPVRCSAVYSLQRATGHNFADETHSRTATTRIPYPWRATAIFGPAVLSTSSFRYLLFPSY